LRAITHDLSAITPAEVWYQLCGKGITTVFGLNKAKSIVGLDIGSSAVKAVELKSTGKGYRVTAFGSEPIPPDSIVDGAIIDGTAVADAIRRLFELRGISVQQLLAGN